MKKTSCKVTKNPCKICFQTVTKKTGVQCCGACQKWVHFACLNFTPGKIKDIKDGIIKIMCPCPDCTSEPKEVLVNPPFTCANQKCPANNAPKCEEKGCPVNNGGIVCSKDQCSKSAYRDFAPAPTSENPSKTGQSCCGGSQQQNPAQYSPPQFSPPQFSPPQYSPPFSRPQYKTIPPCESSQELQDNNQCPSDQCTSDDKLQTENNLKQVQSESDSSMENADKYKSQSCCCVSKKTGPSNTKYSPATVKESLSDSCFDFVNKDNRNDRNRHNVSMECALEQMCKTVGILTHQIKDLMCKFMDK